MKRHIVATLLLLVSLLWPAQAGWLPLATASAVLWTTLDPLTNTNTTLSNGNLTATNSATTTADQGAHAPSTAGKLIGKYYFECTFVTIAGGGNIACGVGTTASTYSGLGDFAIQGAQFYPNFSTGSIIVNNSTFAHLGTQTSGATVAVATDLDNLRIWFKVLSPVAGSWNNNGSADPATNVGGATITNSGVAMVPFVTFGDGGGVANNVTTLNLGASVFAGAVPSGFTAGWTP